MKPGQTKKHIYTPAVCILILAYIASFAFVNFCGLNRFINHDIYADTLVARYMWEQKTLFPENWVFGNQFYVIATPVLAALFYGLTGSMNTGMALATTAMTILIFCSLCYALRPYLSFPHCLLAILTLAASNVAIQLATNFEAQLLFTLASYYACYLITVLVVFGDYVRSLLGETHFRPAALVLSAVLSFATGMQSIRQTAIMIVPVVSFEALRLFYHCIIQKNKPNAEFLKPTLRVFVYAAANLCGVVFIKLLNIPSYSIYGNMTLSSPELWGQNLQGTVAALRQILGIAYVGQYDHSWFLAIFSVYAILTTVAAVVRILFSKTWGGLEYTILLLCVSMAELFAGSILVDFQIRSIYFFLWFPTMALCQVYLVIQLRKIYKQVFAVLVLVMCTANLIYSYVPTVRKIAAIPETHEEAVGKWLCDNGYETVYGPYWSVPGIAMATDGQIVGGCWHDAMFVGLDYVNALDIYDPERNEKAAYYIPDADLRQALEYAEAFGGLTCIRDFGDSALYQSEKPLMVLPGS